MTDLHLWEYWGPKGRKLFPRRICICFGQALWVQTPELISQTWASLIMQVLWIWDPKLHEDRSVASTSQKHWLFHHIELRVIQTNSQVPFIADGFSPAFPFIGSNFLWYLVLVPTACVWGHASHPPLSRWNPMLCKCLRLPPRLAVGLWDGLPSLTSAPPSSFIPSQCSLLFWYLLFLPGFWVISNGGVSWPSECWKWSLTYPFPHQLRAVHSKEQTQFWLHAHQHLSAKVS